MEEVFWLSSHHVLTIDIIQDILAQKIAVKYDPELVVPAENTGSTSLSGTEWMALAIGLGPEVPVEITRLMLLLQADYLSKIAFPAASASIKRLLDFYEYEIFPQLFTQGLFCSPTAHLLLPVFGTGKVYYQGYLLNTTDVYDIFSWPPVPWPKELPADLLQAPTFGLSYLVYCFIQFRKIFRFMQVLLPEVKQAANLNNLFPTQITQLEVQLNEALALPQEQQVHLSGLSYQLEKLLTKFSEHVTDRFSEAVIHSSSVSYQNENIQANPATIQKLAASLTLANLHLYEGGRAISVEVAPDSINLLLIQPYQMLQNLEQITAIITFVTLTGEEYQQIEKKAFANLKGTYRNQVLSVLKDAAFAELTRKTTGFMYKNIPDISH